MIYHWQTDGAWQLGRPVVPKGDGIVSYGLMNSEFWLMLPLYSTVPEWVPADTLKPYPSEEIPQPGAEFMKGSE